MSHFRCSHIFALIALVFSTVSAEAMPSIQWISSQNLNSAPVTVPSGQQYTVGIMVLNPDPNTTYQATVTKGSANFITSTVTSPPFGNAPLTIGPANTSDTGNINVYYSATVTASGSNQSVSSSLAIRAVVSDTTAPSVPTGLTVTSQLATQFTLGWNASTDNQLVDHYEIDVNGTFAGKTLDAGTSYTVTNLTAGTNYSITVKAIDWAGNVSTASAPLSVTLDGTAPTQPGTLTFSGIGIDHATITWAASTDNSGTISDYEVVVRSGSSSGSIVSDQITGTNSFMCWGLVPATAYYVSVVAHDPSENASPPKTGNFTSAADVVDAVTGVQSINIVSNGFTLVWNPPDNRTDIADYAIFLNGSNNAYAESPSTSAVITGLNASTIYSVQVQAQVSTGKVSALSTALSVTTTSGTPPPGPVTTLPAVPYPTVSGSTIVAASAGEVTVDNHGAANCSIPIHCPPGRAGLQPALALVYNSTGGNGIAGVGWSLSTGFPTSITRGRSIMARDNQVRGVLFNDDLDNFYLDGKRLLCTGGTSGHPGSTYRTEVDSFMTITASQNVGPIQQFIAVDREGRKYTFGMASDGTLGGFQRAGGEITAMGYAFALTRVEDTVGNYISFTYKDLGNGEFVLDTISYTGAPGITPNCTINFYYTERTDQPMTFSGGRYFAHRARLALVTAKVGSSQLASAYQLGYQEPSFATASSAARSLLLTVAPALVDPTDLTLHPCPAITINWAPYSDTFATTGTQVGTPPGFGANMADSNLVQWADTDGSGKDQPKTNTSGVNTMYGDIDGDGKQDSVTITSNYQDPASLTMTAARSDGTPIAIPQDVETAFANLFFDPITPSYTDHTTLLLQNEGPAAMSRITLTDYTGDGRADVLVHSYDGYLYLFESTGNGFKPPVRSQYFIGGQGSVSWVEAVEGMLHTDWWKYTHLTVDSHCTVKAFPCDLNGDGRTDYVFVETDRQITSSPVTYGNFRQVTAVLSQPNGGFSAPMTVNVFNPISAGGSGTSNIALDDVNSGIFVGDFNGDGLTDILVLDNKNIASSRWLLYLSNGQDAQGRPSFQAPIIGAIPNTVPVGGDTVYTYYNPVTPAGWGQLSLPSTALTDPGYAPMFAAIESAAGSTNTYVMDVNHDGIADLVWYVGAKTDGTSTTHGGWYAMLSTGKFPTGQPPNTGGFIGPVKIDLLNTITSVMTPTSTGNTFSGARFSWGPDVNGDGHPDIHCQLAANGRPNDGGTVYQATNTTFPNLVSSIVDGLGRTTQVAYKAAKDDSVYTAGVAVSYPIREVRSAQPVVSDVYQDAGSNSTSDNAHFAYQYSGNRLDLSGRGSLGFHSFVTMDTQTGVFKYQFLAQSFPMTGLAVREETYRSLGGGSFNMLSSHSNTVVFDKVVKSATDSMTWGTLYPFISQAIEYRWEDGAKTLSPGNPTNGPTTALPEGLFANKADPTTAHIAITATSLFDNETAPLLTLPTLPQGMLPYDPGDTDSSGSSNVNVVAGAKNSNDLQALINNLGGTIIYGNLARLTTDYGSGYGEQVNNTYYGPTSNGITGLVQNTQTLVWGGGHGTSGTPEKGPFKSYTYSVVNGVQTPLVATEAADANQAAPNPDGTLSTTTSYNRDGNGRVTSTTLHGQNLQYLNQASLTYTVSSVQSFDSRFDLPTQTQDAYGHPTTTAYTIMGQPNSVTGPNNDQTTYRYDGYGRATRVVDPFGVETDASYLADTAGTVAGPTGVNGLTLAYAYHATTTTVAAGTNVQLKPTVTAYFDRLGRTLRTAKGTFSGGNTYTDTIYDKLGRVVAVSNPYDSAATPYWTTMQYDPVGRVWIVTAPNNTVTTTIYQGRATTVKVQAADEPAQTNATVVDAKGRTVRVWNADNAPTFAAPVLATTSLPAGSLEFDLDGFGRMRTTTTHPVASGTSVTVSATYDALGHQLTLNDPDKGPWSYVNSALGQVLQQTDANGTVTATTYDRLERPVTRTTTEAAGVGGAVETANWYYYDNNPGISPNTVAVGAKGWIGALQRDECTTSGAAGYATANSATKTVHYYDGKGRPSIDIAMIDGKYFYTYSGWLEPGGQDYNRINQVQHYWRPSGHEDTSTDSLAWQSFGYSYTYDGQGYLNALKDALGRTWWQPGTNGYDYMDRPVLVQKGNGVWTQRTYSPVDGTLTGIATGTTAGGSSIQNLAYTYDGLGNLKSRTDGLRSGLSENYGYDVLNRVSTRTFGTQTNTTIASYQGDGNITSKLDVGGQGVSITGYDPAHPHAVKTYTYNGQTVNMGYDANGNVNARSSGADTWNFKYTGFDKPRWMAKNGKGSEFLFNAHRSRTAQVEFDAMSGGAPSHYTHKRIYALGSTLEINYENSAGAGVAPSWELADVRIYVPGPDGVIGAREFKPVQASSTRKVEPGSMTSTQPTDQEKALLYHYDHLGSIEAITPAFGSGTGQLSLDDTGKQGLYSEDAWGQRRNPSSWGGAPTTTDTGGHTSLTPRGFTGHEMLDDLGLVHMNGRIYDPLLGRFLSADIEVQSPGNLQSYNRYSYVLNNPLRFTDPTGFETYWEGVGNMFLGYADAGKALVTGTVSAALHPVDTTVGLVKAAAHPLTTAKAVATSVSETWNSGTRGKGNVVATALLAVATAVAPGAEAGAVSKVAEVSNVASKGEEVAALGQKAAAVAEKTASVVDGGETSAGSRIAEAAHPTDPVPEIAPKEAPTSGGGCFMRGTLVATPTGLVPIELIKVGDVVISRESKTGKLIERKVLETPRHFTFFWVEVAVLGRTITATRFHRFWVESKGTWIAAVDLKPGMAVRLADGTTALIKSTKLRALEDSEKTFNLVVDVDHNYFVSASCILVHNGTPLDEEGHWNYHLEDGNGKTYYHGRAGPNQTQTDVEYRHMNTGDRFSPANGDKFVVDAENVTYGESRVNEHIAIEQDGTNIGRGASTDRGNKQSGISGKNGEKYHEYIENRANGGGC